MVICAPLVVGGGGAITILVSACVRGASSYK